MYFNRFLAAKAGVSFENWINFIFHKDWLIFSIVQKSEILKGEILKYHLQLLQMNFKKHRIFSFQIFKVECFCLDSWELS